MIRIFIAALSWLDQRFPPKVTVTKEGFEALLDREHARMKSATSFRIDLDTQKDRIKGLETSVAAIKELLSKGGAVGPAMEHRRAEFVKTGRMGE